MNGKMPAGSTPIRFRLRLVSVLVVAIAASSAAAATLDRDGAYSLLTERATAGRTAFFVYRDADSAFNHGSSSLVGTSGRAHLDAACVDEPSSANGCSADSNRLDRARGNVLSVSFDPLGAAETAGLSLHGPTAHQTGKVFDLSGATSLSFDVRSPSTGGITVRFGVGGRMTEFIHVPRSDSYSGMNIPLQSLKPDAPSLQDVQVLFTVDTDGARAGGGGTILLDNIRFLPAPDSRSRVIGFPVAYETFGIVPATQALPGRVPIPVDQTVRNASTIYDSSLTLMALLERGTAQDRANAEGIADALHHALHHGDEAGLSGQAVSPGKATIRNGYIAGDLAFLNDDQPSVEAGQTFLAGFTAGPEVCGASSYCFVLDGATGRNVGFAILGLVAAYQSLGHEEYLADAQMLGAWIVSELADTSTTGFGGYYLGYADREEPRQLSRAKSVEDNAVIFAALSRLNAADRDPRAGAGGVGRWTVDANRAGDFVMRLFDADAGRFHAGTVPSGTGPSFGVAPGGLRAGNDIINTYESPEANTIAVLAIAGAGRYRGLIDWRRPLQWLVGGSITVPASGTSFSGFGVGPQTSLGPAGISWGLTAQAIAAMRLVDCLHKGTFQPEIASLASQLALAQSAAPFGDGRGLVGSTLANGDALPPSEHCLSTATECVPQRVGLAATSWAIFADLERNPLSSTGSSVVCAMPRRRAVR
jgi:type IV secretory pathway VirB2 component (pilin)